MTVAIFSSMMTGRWSADLWLGVALAASLRGRLSRIERGGGDDLRVSDSLMRRRVEQLARAVGP